MKEGKCSLCVADNETLWRKQVIFLTNFKSQQTNKSNTIFYVVHCSLVHMLFTICRKHYVGKAETSFNILNNHRIDVKKRDAILACWHFQERNHIINKHTKFIILPPRQRLIERKYLDSNAANITPTRIEPRAKLVLLLNAQFDQHYCSYVTHVKFYHNLSKTIRRQVHFVKMYFKISIEDGSSRN